VPSHRVASEPSTESRYRRLIDLRRGLDEAARALDGYVADTGQTGPALQRVCDDLVTAMSYPFVAIALADVRAGGPFVAQAGSTFGQPGGGHPDAAGRAFARWAHHQAANSPVSDARRTRRTQVAALDEAARPAGTEGASRFGGRARMAIIPLLAPASVVGVLCAGASDAESFEDDQLSALEAFAGRLSMAIQLAQHQALLALQSAAMASSSCALFITDASGSIEWVNAAFEKTSGYTRDEVVGRTPGILRSELQSSEVFQSMWAAVRAGHAWRGEIVNRRKSGETYVVTQNVTPLLDENRTLTHLVAAHDDVTAHRQAETRLEHMAHHDALTDLPNRALFAERLSAALAQAEREGGSVGVLFVDLDRFKLVNETFGHQVGDQLLREVAGRLKSSVRELDMVARFDGDEFTIVLPGCDRIVATLVAERIMAALSRPLRIGNQEVAITASIGVAMRAPDARDADTLLRRADAAMYQAKEVGRNGYAFFHDGPDARPVPAFTIQSGLRRALANGELALHYQPQMDACGRRLMGVEALLRWTSPALGVVSPADFIPVAEQTGIIVDIDRWVIRAACAQAKAWQVAGVPVPRIAVNVSGLSFRRGRLIPWIEEALASAQLEPQHLEIELTEGVLMHDAAMVVEALASLRQVGVRLALDDFGVGYSSLGYLKRFKLDVLKIDRSFISGLPGDPDSVAIARLIVAMAKTLHLETTAEGVETVDQAMFLEGLGCDTLQGYLFSRPVPAAELSRFAQLR